MLHGAFLADITAPDTSREIVVIPGNFNKSTRDVTALGLENITIFLLCLEYKPHGRLQQLY